jgi:hypothetical protein
MDTNLWTVRGTLKPDGTLELDEKPPLAVGRVKVTIQPEASGSEVESLMQLMARIWADQRTRGQVSRSKEEIDAAIAGFREEAHEEMQAIEKLHEKCRQAREEKGQERP